METDDVTDKELSEMIADLMHTENWPDRTRLCLALIELRALKQSGCPLPSFRSSRPRDDETDGRPDPSKRTKGI